MNSLPKNRHAQHPSVTGTLTVATCNVLNLARPHRMFYANQEPYSQSEYERKIKWLGERFADINADIVAVQEIWDESAIKAAIKSSGLRYDFIKAPGTEHTDAQGHPLPEETSGAQGTPRVGIIGRLPVLAAQSHADIPLAMQAHVPEIGVHTRFERPPLMVTFRLKNGHPLHVLTAHMKSKRPKFLQDDKGNYLEDKDDPKILARAGLRSLIIRGIEAAALRAIVLDAIAGRKNRGEALIMLGDFNDSPHSVTTQLIAATHEVAYERAASDIALFNAYDLQSQNGLRRDVAYSHVYQGYPEVLDQIFVSEEFVSSSKFAMGDVARVDYFNDHLHQGKSRDKSDHGFVRAVLRLYDTGL